VPADCAATLLPSPQLKAYVSMPVASLSVEAEASAVTLSGAVPDVGVSFRAALGGSSAGGGGGAVTLTDAVAVDARSAVSVTVTVTV